jgi:uncharacterized protein YebE (UPF0316 family)
VIIDTGLFDSALWSFVIVPLLIVVARICDVTLGSIRIIFLARGRRLASLLGFFEVLIWLLAIRQIMQNLNNPVTYIAYATGFAGGNLIGIYLEERLAVGTLIIRMITAKDVSQLIGQLHAQGYGVTCVDGQGATGQVRLVYTVIRRKDLPEVRSIIAGCCPKAFLSIEEVRAANEGIFPPEVGHRRWWPVSSGWLRHKRK